MPELMLPRLKREIEARLAELRPAVVEAEQLEAAKRALLEERALAPARRYAAPRQPEPESVREPDPEPEPQPPRRRGGVLEGERVLVREPAPRPAPRRPATATASDAEGAAPSDPTRDAIIALVEERPGVSVAEIVGVTKLEKADVAATVAQLKRDGVLADEAGGVKLASRKPLTLAQIAAAATREDGVSDEEWAAARPRR